MSSNQEKKKSFEKWFSIQRYYIQQELQHCSVLQHRLVVTLKMHSFSEHVSMLFKNSNTQLISILKTSPLGPAAHTQPPPKPRNELQKSSGMWQNRI